MSSDRFDRRGLGVLATGHLWADFLQGAIPALLPFLIAERGYSYGAAPSSDTNAPPRRGNPCRSWTTSELPRYSPQPILMALERNRPSGRFLSPRLPEH